MSEPAPLPLSRWASRPGPTLATRPRGTPLAGALASRSKRAPGRLSGMRFCSKVDDLEFAALETSCEAHT